MGGAIVIRASVALPDIIDGTISSVPAADRFKRPEMVRAAKVAWNYLIDPKRNFDVGTSIIKQASQDKEMQQQWKEDNDARLYISPEELIRFNAFMKQNLKYAAQLTKPILITQGDKDHLVKPDSTIKLYKSVGSSDKDLLLIGKAQHLIFELQEPTPLLLEGVVSWLKHHCQPAAPVATAPVSDETTARTNEITAPAKK
jgi:alpha-beta hydrolase superfamily lysophospholipase